MRTTFRQGIIRRQTPLSGPQWIQRTSLSASTVDINVNFEPTVFTIAHYGANYLFEESHSIVAAWGGGTPQSNNGPLPAGQTTYLYWDVDLATGDLSHGWTMFTPVTAASPPLNPVDDQHWFDTVNTRMRVWRQNGSAPGQWIDKIRLFAAIYDNNAILIPYALGSQVGITGGEYGCGHLIRGTNNKPLRQSDGTFCHTETDLIIYQTSGQNVRFDMALVYAQAIEPIPKFTLVSFQPDRRIARATCNDFFRFVSGAVIEDLHTEEVGQVITNGVVRNEQWDWSAAQINAPIFCGPQGEFLLTPPTVGVVQQVGYVYDADSIYLNLYPPVRIR